MTCIDNYKLLINYSVNTKISLHSQNLLFAISCRDLILQIFMEPAKECYLNNFVQLVLKLLLKYCVKNHGNIMNKIDYWEGSMHLNGTIKQGKDWRA